MQKSWKLKIFSMLEIQVLFPINPIPIWLLWFRSKTMPQIKGKRQAGINLIPPDQNRVNKCIIIFKKFYSLMDNLRSYEIFELRLDKRLIRLDWMQSNLKFILQIWKKFPKCICLNNLYLKGQVWKPKKIFFL